MFESKNTDCIYLNTYSYNQHHEIFNTLLVKALHNIYNSVSVYSTRSSWNYISRNIIIDTLREVVQRKTKIGQTLNTVLIILVR